MSRNRELVFPIDSKSPSFSLRRFCQIGSLELLSARISHDGREEECDKDDTCTLDRQGRDSGDKQKKRKPSNALPSPFFVEPTLLLLASTAYYTRQFPPAGAEVGGIGER